MLEHHGPFGVFPQKKNEFIQNEQNASSVYSFYDMGWLKIKKAGKHKITVALVDGDFENTSLESMEIRRIE